MIRSYVLLAIFILFSSFQAFAVEFPVVKSKDMTYTRLQKLRYSYVQFMVKVEADQKQGHFPELKKKTTYFKQFWRDLLISNAYAIAEDGSICFFGGWPSRMSGGKCSTPWRNKSDEDMQRLGAYDQSAVCGSSTKFRCNPTLFGSPTDDGKGICIDTDGTYNHLTEKCERASRSQVPKIIESYKADPTAIDALGAEIKNFCDSYESYDSCDDLARRIKEITGGDIGQYSGGSSETDRVGGRTHNATVQGEHLRPGADFVERSSEVGAEILDRCQNLLKDKSDVKGRNVLSYMDTKACSEEISGNYTSMSDIENVAKTVDKKQTVLGVNAKAFEQNMLALLSNDIRFGQSGRNYTDKDALFNNMVKDYPALKNNEEYKKAFGRAFEALDREVRAGRLFPFELESTREQFNNLSSMVNEACSKIRDKYVQKFGDPGYFSRWSNSDQHDAFFASEVRGLHQEINVLLEESVVGHLMSTEHFKDNVFDPSEEAVVECARNPSFQLIKQPIAASTVSQGHKEVDEMLKKNLSKISDRAKELNNGDNDDITDVLDEYIKNDPRIVSMTMDDLGAKEQEHLGVLICNQTNDILSSDRNWRYVDITVGTVGTAAGIVLMATGIGSPLGVALTAASLGMAGYTGGRAINQYQNAAAQMRAADIALAERRERMQGYLEVAVSTGALKKEALWKGGLAVVMSISPVKALGSTRAGQAVARSMPKVKMPKVTTPKVTTPKIKVPTINFLKRKPTSVSGVAKKPSKLKKIFGFGLAVWAGSTLYEALKPDEQLKVQAEAKQVFEANGAKLPSEVIAGQDIYGLELEAATKLLEQMTGSPLNEENYLKLYELVSPETYAEQPPAMQQFIEQEAMQFQMLVDYINLLQEQDPE